MNEWLDSADANKWLRLFGVISLALAFYFLYFQMDDRPSIGWFWLAILLFPTATGFALQLVFDPCKQRSLGDMVWWGIIVFVILSLPLLFFDVETIICIAMAAPFLIVGLIVGVIVARGLIGALNLPQHNKLRVSLVGLPFLLGFMNLQVGVTDDLKTVTNQISIEAPANVVWSHIVNFGSVAETERKWTVSHNILYATRPVRSSLEGNIRTAEWTKGVRYEEHITQFAAPYAMAWNIHFAENFAMDGFDDHISPSSEQFSLLSGYYALSEVDGVTAVTLTTSYQLKTPFNGYVGLWGRLFLGDNHNSILHVLKLRSEAMI